MRGQQGSEALRIVTSSPEFDDAAREFIETVEGIPATDNQALQSCIGDAVEAIIHTGLQGVLPEVIGKMVHDLKLANAAALGIPACIDSQGADASGSVSASVPEAHVRRKCVQPTLPIST